MDNELKLTGIDLSSKKDYSRLTLVIPKNYIDIDKAKDIEDIKHILKNLYMQPRHDSDIDEKFKHLWVKGE